MNSLVKTAMAAILATGLSAGATSYVFAAGETTVNEPKECPKGEVWDKEAMDGTAKGKCVAEADFKKKPKDEQQGMIYNYGRGMAKAGHYEKAIAALKMAPDQGDPRVLNYLGYSNRKLGNMDVALGYYRAAVAKNPDFSLVREYLGEAYIQLGLLEKAREQLSEIERICGSKACDEYGQLASLIVESQTTRD